MVAGSRISGNHSGNRDKMGRFKIYLDSKTNRIRWLIGYKDVKEKDINEILKFLAHVTA